ncbi:hypothetical protein [Microvirga pudoricolor]|uniref:hypothetical protein n=1 Tax=Microvirga pudoricolor TaxID=2778729 RepID=UPI00194EBA9F|nr:hypothetical protein [Microvirga pudoricolor]MBM6595573.1 hypothetical protein [Microvirga pudoricolor]
MAEALRKAFERYEEDDGMFYVSGVYDDVGGDPWFKVEGEIVANSFAAILIDVLNDDVNDDLSGDASE